MEKKTHSSLNDSLVNLFATDFEPAFFEGLVRMAFELNIDGNKLIDKLAHEYMRYVYENVCKKKAYIVSHTGFKRNTVENFIKSYESSKLAPQTKPDSIFNDYVHQLRSACKESKDLSLPIHGYHSCHSIFLDSNINNKTLTLPSVLSILEKCGYIQIFDQHVVFTQTLSKETMRSDKDLSRQFSNVVNDFSSTQIHNKYEGSRDKRYFSYRIDSIDIPDEKITLTVNQLNEILRSANKQSFAQLEENEDHENNDKRDVVSTNSYQIGIQQYLFVTKRGKP